MFSKIRSLIFKFEPEVAHSLAIKALKYNFVPPKKIPNNDDVCQTSQRVEPEPNK